MVYTPWYAYPLNHLDPPRCGDRLSVHVVTMALMSELPAGDTHDVIHRRGEEVAVVVPIAEYRQLRQAVEEQRVNDEFDAARTEYLARREAGAIRYVSHEEAGRRLPGHVFPVSYQVNWEIRALDLAAGFLRDDPAGVAALWESVSRLTDEPRPLVSLWRCRGAERSAA